SQFLTLAQVGGEGHHLAAVGHLQPLDDGRRVQAAGVGEHDFLGRRLGGHGGPLGLRAALKAARVKVSTLRAAYWREVRGGGAQTVSWAPSSTTRPGGILKNSVGLAAFFIRKMNS